MNMRERSNLEVKFDTFMGNHWLHMVKDVANLQGQLKILIGLVSVLTGKMMAIRPQIIVAIIAATMFSMFAAWLAYKMDAVEVMTAIIGGVFGLLGGVSLRIIDNEPPESE